MTEDFKKTRSGKKNFGIPFLKNLTVISGFKGFETVFNDILTVLFICVDFSFSSENPTPKKRKKNGDDVEKRDFVVTLWTTFHLFLHGAI